MTTTTGWNQDQMEGIVELQPVTADTDADFDVDPQGTMRLRVERLERAADKVLFLTLVDPGGAALPPWDAGAHLELCLPSTLRRQYSLCGDPADRHSYTVAVLRVDDGRGGSIEIHDTGLVGRTLEVRGPINNFRLVDANSYLLLAGGIGITPIIGIASALRRGNIGVQLHYAVKSHADAAYLDELSTMLDDRLIVHASDEGRRLDLHASFRALPDDAIAILPGLALA